MVNCNMAISLAASKGMVPSSTATTSRTRSTRTPTNRMVTTPTTSTTASTAVIRTVTSKPARRTMSVGATLRMAGLSGTSGDHPLHRPSQLPWVVRQGKKDVSCRNAQVADIVLAPPRQTHQPQPGPSTTRLPARPETPTKTGSDRMSQNSPLWAWKKGMTKTPPTKQWNASRVVSLSIAIVTLAVSISRPIRLSCPCQMGRSPTSLNPMSSRERPVLVPQDGHGKVGGVKGEMAPSLEVSIAVVQVDRRG